MPVFLKGLATLFGQVLLYVSAVLADIILKLSYAEGLYNNALWWSRWLVDAGTPTFGTLS